MAPLEAYVARNAASRERLRQLVARLAPEDLQRSLGDGWTVGACFAHLAWADRRVQHYLEHWERDQSGAELPDAGAISEEHLAAWGRMPPEESVRAALEAAEAVDAKIASLPPDVVAQLEKTSRPYVLDRSRHRDESIDNIARAVVRGV